MTVCADLYAEACGLCGTERKRNSIAMQNTRRIETAPLSAILNKPVRKPLLYPLSYGDRLESKRFCGPGRGCARSLFTKPTLGIYARGLA